MAERQEEAAAQHETLIAELERDGTELREKLNGGELVSVADLKTWRRGWVDKAVPIRKLARAEKKEGDEDTADDVKKLAGEIEERARDLESELIDIARELEEAQERGGVLTHEERAARAAGDSAHVRGITCPACGSALPDKDAPQCAYCGKVLRETDVAISKGWVMGGLDGATLSGSAADVAKSGRARIDALEKAYVAQLEYEKQGLTQVLRAGQRRTQEFEHACDDATTRLDRIWNKIREVGRQVTDRLSDLDADDLEEEIDEHVDALTEKLDSIKESVFEGLHREAAVAWNRSQADGDNVVNCAQCGADLEVANPYVEGEATCPYCSAITKYSPHLDGFTVQLKHKVDQQMADQRPVEETFRHWKQVCAQSPSAENYQQLEAAARAMYDKQMFYIADADKRKEAVDRYVAQVLKESGA